MLKDIIAHVVNNAQGLKGVDVAVEVVKQEVETSCVDIDGISIIEALEQLVKEKEIVEIEYILPAMPNTLKSFYLPKGTQLFGNGVVRRMG